MKIILSPSKSQCHLNNCLSYNQPKYLAKSLYLFNELKKYSRDDLVRIMKIKGKTLDNTYQLYQTFDSYMSPKQSAIHTYTGVVYDGINLSNYSKEQVAYLNSHVRILSAMYGVLKPSDCIYPYRLDFTMKFDHINLHQYWREEILNEFKNEDVIIDLASTEFTQLLSPLKETFHAVEFYDVVNGKEKVVSFSAKKMRGLMCDQLITHQISDVNSIKQLHMDAYRYRDNPASKHKSVFVKL